MHPLQPKPPIIDTGRYTDTPIMGGFISDLILLQTLVHKGRLGGMPIQVYGENVTGTKKWIAIVPDDTSTAPQLIPIFYKVQVALLPPTATEEYVALDLILSFDPNYRYDDSHLPYLGIRTWATSDNSLILQWQAATQL